MMADYYLAKLVERLGNKSYSKLEVRGFPALSKECVLVFTDSSTNPNPGIAGVGILLKDYTGKLLHRERKPLGFTTNNVAEGYGVCRALELCRLLGYKRVQVLSDSELLLHLFRTGRTSLPHLRYIKGRFDRASRRLDEVQLYWIPREMNKEADQLAESAYQLNKSFEDTSAKLDWMSNILSLDLIKEDEPR